MNFHKVPFVVLAVVVLVLSGSLTYFWQAYKEPLPPENGWGAAHTLSLNITLERSNISINETLNFTATLQNTGSEGIRIYPWNWRPDILVLYTTRVFIKHQVPATDQPPPSDAAFNRMLVVLEPNGTYSRGGYIKTGTSWGDSWDIRPGMNYSIVSSFHYDETRGYPALPVWNGMIQSRPEHFSVLP